jgi:signal transduction histidine kinase
MCQEVIGELPGDCKLVIADPDSVPTAGDFFIWDFQPGFSIPNRIAGQPTWKHLVLVHRNDIGHLHPHKASAGPVFLLKPVTRVTLSAFLDQARTVFVSTPAPPAAIMSENSDELLQCLIQTNLKLQEYDQERANFLARAVHDFRSPLTAINGYAGLLIAEPLGPLNEDQKEVLRRMQHSAKRLSRMASAMFQLTVGDQKKAHPYLERGDLQECMDQVIHEIGPLIEEKHIDLSVDLRTSIDPLFFDQGQMEQILLNLLENACKFTPKTGSIEVNGYCFFWERRGHRTRASATEQRVQDYGKPNSFRIDIHDSGPGIPVDQLDSIFEQYTQYLSTQDRTGGGLGLAICKMLMNRHQGRVWAETSASGATFSLVIPFSAEVKNDVRAVKYVAA